MEKEIKRITTKELKQYNVDKTCPLYPDDLRKSYDLDIKNMGDYWTIVGRKKVNIDRKKYMAEWKANNPDKVKEYNENKKAKGGNKYNADYYAKNKEMYRDNQYRWFEKNKEKWNNYQKEYYAKNKEKIRQQQKDYQDLKKIN